MSIWALNLRTLLNNVITVSCFFGNLKNWLQCFEVNLRNFTIHTLTYSSIELSIGTKVPLLTRAYVTIAFLANIHSFSGNFCIHLMKLLEWLRHLLRGVDEQSTNDYFGCFKLEWKSIKNDPCLRDSTIYQENIKSLWIFKLSMLHGLYRYLWQNTASFKSHNPAGMQLSHSKLPPTDREKNYWKFFLLITK